MMRGINLTDQAKRQVNLTDKTQRRVNVVDLAQNLGAADVSTAPAHGGSPATWSALRQEVAARLRSTGGRPGLPDAEPRKVALTPQEWEVANELAEALAEPGFRPSAGQIAGILLGHALREAKASLAQGARQQLRAALDRPR